MSRNLFFISALFMAVLWAGMAGAQEVATLAPDTETDDANIGSGKQVNANDWHSMFDVNAGGNQLTGGGTNSNGGDRDSMDVVIIAGDGSEVASYALDASVTSNSINVAGDHASADSSFEFTDNSGFKNSYGVTAVSVNAGASASQSVSVNVTSSVDLGSIPADY